jgi:hypothetical protein
LAGKVVLLFLAGDPEIKVYDLFREPGAGVRPRIAKGKLIVLLQTAAAASVSASVAEGDKRRRSGGGIHSWTALSLLL